MTTAYLQLTGDAAVETAMARLRAESEDLDIIDYVFVVDREEVLEGVVSIRNLLTAQPQQPLSELLAPRVVSVKLDGNQKEVVEAFAKYGFRAVPVVDEDNHLRGVISFRSVLEVLAPDAG